MGDNEATAQIPSWGADGGYAGEIPFGEPECPRRDEVGLAAVLHWLNCHRWIHRRSESIELADATVGTREMQVAFTIPQTSPQFKIQGAEHCCLPISLLRKQKVNLYVLTDDEHVERPLLTRHMRGAIAADGLVRLASALIAKALGQPLPTDLEEDLRTAARAKPLDSIAVMQRMEGKAQVADPLSAACRALLMGYEAFRLVTWSLALNSMVLVRLPFEPGATRTLTARYDEPLNEVPPGGGLGRLKRMAARTAGVAPKKMWFPARVLPEPSSNHYRVIAPDGLQISTATLAVEDLESSAPDTGKTKRTPSVQQQIGKFDDWRERERETGSLGAAHLYDRELPEYNVALVRINLRPTASGTLRAIWFTAAVSLGLLVVTGISLRSIRGTGADETAAQSASALLLLIPTLLAAYVARPGEHNFTSELLFGTRLLGLLAGATTLAAACYLVLTDPSRKLGGNWLPLILVSALVFSLLTLSSALNWAMKYSERQPSPAAKRIWRSRAAAWRWFRRRLEGAEIRRSDV